MKKALKLRVGDETVRLRLTLGGQKRLKARRGEDTLLTILVAPTDADAMAALLDEALNWEDSGNTITSGEALYDLLVDSGYTGQERFGALAFDLAACSGLVSEEQAARLKEALRQAVSAVYDKLETGAADGVAAEASGAAGTADKPSAGTAESGDTARPTTAA